MPQIYKVHPTFMMATTANSLVSFSLEATLGVLVWWLLSPRSWPNYISDWQSALWPYPRPSVWIGVWPCETTQFPLWLSWQCVLVVITVYWVSCQCVLQCTTVYCSVLQCTAVYYSVLQCTSHTCYITHVTSHICYHDNCITTHIVETEAGCYSYRTTHYNQGLHMHVLCG